MARANPQIAVAAPASPITRETADGVATLAKATYGEAAPEIYFHPQCFLSAGHFAGTDDERSQAFLDVANDARFSAVWFARGGYGSCRLDDRVFEKLNEHARVKTYFGYSDLGSLLARLYSAGVGRPVHGPMPQDIAREGGDDAIRRALAFLMTGDTSGAEPSVRANQKFAAFNLATLAHLMSAPWRPDFSDHIVMVEDVSEYHYQIDRSFFSITSDETMRNATGIMLGRCTDIPENDRPFGASEEEIAQYWCARAGIPYLGRADIGHDADNKIVPFGESLLA